MAEQKIKFSAAGYNNIYNLRVKDKNNTVRNVNELIMKSDDDLIGVWSRGVYFDTRKSGDIPMVGFGTKIGAGSRSDNGHRFIRSDRGLSKIYIPYVQNSIENGAEYDNSPSAPSGRTPVTYVFPIWYLPIGAETDTHRRQINSIDDGHLIKLTNPVTKINDAGLFCYMYTKTLCGVQSTWTGRSFPNKGWSNSYSHSRYTKSFQFSSENYGSHIANNKIYNYDFSSYYHVDDRFKGTKHVWGYYGLQYYNVTISSTNWSRVRLKIDYLNEIGNQTVSTYSGNNSISVLAGSTVYITPCLVATSENNTNGYAKAIISGNSNDSMSDNKTIYCGLLEGKVDILNNYPNSFTVCNDCTVTIGSEINSRTDYGPSKVSYSSRDSWQQIKVVGSGLHCTTIDLYSTYDSSNAPTDTSRYTIVKKQDGSVIGWVPSSMQLCYKTYTNANGYGEGYLHSNWTSSKFKFEYDANGFITKIYYMATNTGILNFWIWLV